MAKTKKTIVAKKIIKSSELEESTADFASFIEKVKEEYDSVEIEIVVKSEI